MAAVTAQVMLPVSEVFGPTWQGEGPYTGIRTGFVRLGMCNLSCEWCDTPYTWDTSRYDVAKECPPTTVAEVHARLRTMDVATVCLSGGEPLIHRLNLPHLLHPEWRWHVETNGTIAPPPYWEEFVAHTSVSPKINTRDPLKRRIKMPALRAWNRLAAQGRAAFKFVAATPADLEQVALVADTVGIAASSLWVMPQGTTATEVLTRHRLLAPHIQDRGWQTSTRLHTLLYDEERGR